MNIRLTLGETRLILEDVSWWKNVRLMLGSTQIWHVQKEAEGRHALRRENHVIAWNRRSDSGALRLR